MPRADVPAPEPPTHDDDLAHDDFAPDDHTHDDVAPDDDPADAGGARVPAPRPQPDPAPHPHTSPTPVALTEREVRILAFESKWWKHAGSKEQAIRDAFDLSATRYYQLLNGLLDNPAALEHDPVLIGRLRRLRSTRARVRRR